MKKLFFIAGWVVCLFAVCGKTQAQNTTTLKSLLNSSTLQEVVGTVVGGSIAQSDLYGTWVYTGSACAFESDNLLAKAGGAVAATQIEGKMNGYCTKLGITQGMCKYTFNQDGTFVNQVKGKMFRGTYTFDPSTKKLVLSYLGLVKSTATLAKTGSTLSMLFPADTMLALLKGFSSFSGSTTLKSVGTLASQYEGLKLGFYLKK